MSISVVMCTYNGARFLQAQLDSLLAQTRLPDEIVIRDDVSCDRTVEILEAFVPKAEASGIQINLARNSRNLGYRRNFEQALHAASGELLFLCDQDDVWLPEKLELFEGKFKARPSLTALHSDAWLTDASGKRTAHRLFQVLSVMPGELQGMHDGNDFNMLLRRNIVTGATLAIRRSLLARATPFPESDWVHDEWLAMMAAIVGTMDTIEAPLIEYRQHDANQLGASKVGRVEEVSKKLSEKKQFNAAIVRRMDALLLQISGDSLHASAWQTQQIDARREHAHFRSHLPANPITRLCAIANQARAGHYRAFGSGWRSIISDALHPD